MQFMFTYLKIICGITKYRMSYISLILVITSLMFLRLDLFSEKGSGLPIKYISSCEMDFNKDNEADIALWVETVRGRELIVLIKTKSGYDAFLVSTLRGNLSLSCHFGKFINETSSGKGKKDVKVYETPGTYIQLSEPEGSSIVYFWNGNGFTEVWTSD